MYQTRPVTSWKWNKQQLPCPILDQDILRVKQKATKHDEKDSLILGKYTQKAYNITNG